MTDRTIFQCKTITGGDSISLDNIDGNLLFGDELAFVHTSAKTLYIYQLNASSGQTQSVPSIISPINNAGSKRWELLSVIVSDINSSSPDNQTANGNKTTLTYGASITKGQLLYMGSGGKLLPAKADAAGTIPATYLALEDGADTESHTVLRCGFWRNDSATAMTPGALIYVSDITAGSFTTTRPSAVGSFVQIVGIATAAHIIDFNPSSTTVGL
ncbi:MAG: hypothetical protein AB2L12_00990 [Smithellaceae bacterium]